MLDNEQTIDNDAAPTAVSELAPQTQQFDLAEIATRDRLTTDQGATFVTFGAPPLYDKHLVGRPFLILAPPVFTTQAEHSTKDGRSFDEQDVAELQVALVLDIGGNKLSAPRKAILSGAFILTELRRATSRQLVGSHIWTLAYNDRLKTKAGGPPRMLKIYEPGKDQPEVPDELVGIDDGVDDALVGVNGQTP